MTFIEEEEDYNDISFQYLLEKSQNIKDQIMKIVQEFIQKGHIIDFNKLYHISLREIRIKGIDDQKLQKKLIILNAINQLNKEKRLVFGQKHIRDFVLKNTNRKKIYQYIKSNPSLNFNKISRDLSLDPKVLLWNIKILQRFDCLIEYKIKNQKIYVIHDTPVEAILLYYFLRNEKIQQILQILSDKSCSNPELAESIHEEYYNIDYHMKILQFFKIIQPTLIIDKRVYEITPNFLKEYKSIIQIQKVIPQNSFLSSNVQKNIISKNE